MLRARRVRRNVGLDPIEYPHGVGGPNVSQRRPANRPAWRRCFRPVRRRHVAPGGGGPVHHPPGNGRRPPANSVSHRRLRLRSFVRRPLRAGRRGDLHEGRGRRRRSRRKSRGGNSGGRSAQSGRHRRSRRRQRRRLRWPRRRSLRVDGRRKHRRDDSRRRFVAVFRPRGGPLSARRPRARHHRVDRRNSDRAHEGRRRPDGRPESRILRDGDTRDDRFRVFDALAPPHGTGARRLVALSPLRRHRNRHLASLRLHHPVLHRVQISAGQGNRRGLPDGPRDEHHHGHRGRVRVHGTAGCGHLVGNPRELLRRTRLRDSECRTLRHGGRDDGDAVDCGLHSRDGHLRPDHRQRGWHRGDVAAAGRDPQENRPSRRGRQYHEGPHEGVRNRFRRPGGVPAFLGLPRRRDGAHAPQGACSARCSASMST